MSEDQVKENQPVENEIEEQEDPIETVENPQEEIAEPLNVDSATAEEEEVKETQPEETLLLPRDTLLSAGIHIGTRMKTLDMEPCIYRVRPDGLFFLYVKELLS